MNKHVIAAILITASAVAGGAIALHACVHGPVTSDGRPAGATPTDAGYQTAVDEKKANQLFQDEHGRRALRASSAPAGFVLVANCEDGGKVFAPEGIYVRARADSGGYTYRKTDPVPVVVPLSYDWCAP